MKGLIIKEWNKAKLSWDIIKDMYDDELLNILSSEQMNSKNSKPVLDFKYLDFEMKYKSAILISVKLLSSL